MTTDLCFKCSNENSILCTICGIAKDGAREHFKQKPVTNYDRLISKPPEELAKTIVGWLADVAELCGENRKEFDLTKAEEYAVSWLKSPVEVDE